MAAVYRREVHSYGAGVSVVVTADLSTEAAALGAMEVGVSVDTDTTMDAY